MLKRVKHLLKILAATLLVLIAIVVLATGVVLQWPTLALNPKTLNWAKTQWNERPGDSTLQWKGVDVGAEAGGLFENRLRLSFSDLCYTSPPSAHVCFPELSVGFAYDLSSWRPGITEVGPVRARGGDIRYTAVEETRSSSEPTQIPELPFWLASAELMPVYIRVDRLAARSGETTVSGNLRVSSRENQTASGQTQSYTVTFNEVTHGRIEVGATSLSHQVKGPWQIQGSANLSLPSKSRLVSRFEMKLAPTTEDRYPYTVQIRFSNPSLRTHLRMQGDVSTHFDEAGELIAGRLRGKIQKPMAVDINECAYSLKRDPGSDAAGLEFGTHCPLALSLDSLLSGELGQALQKLDPARKLTMLIAARFTTSFPPSAESLVSGTVSVRPTGLLSDALRFSGGIETQLALIPAQFPGFEDFQSKIDIGMSIPRFQKLVDRLRGTPFAIPAPLHVLQGRVAFSATGRLDKDGGPIRLAFLTHLGSKYQKLDVRGLGRVTTSLDLGQHLKILGVDSRAEVNLENIKLALPPMGLEVPGAILPDPRIRQASLTELKRETVAEDKEPAFPFTYAVNVTTPPTRPIHLLTDFTPQTIPIEVALRASSSEPLLQGHVAVNAFPLEVVGVRRRVERAEMYVRLTEEQQLLLGRSGLPGSAKLTEVMYAPKPGESLLRPSPKLPLALAEIVSGLALRFPFSLAMVESDTPQRLQPGATEEEQTELQFRKRW
ncbi:MAG: hypothetical protein AB7G93_09175 [Bdellovibrionales bacterium]